MRACRNLFLSDSARKIIFPGFQKFSIPNIYTFNPPPGQTALDMHERTWYKNQVLKHGHIFLKNTGIREIKDVQKWRTKFVSQHMDHQGGQGFRDKVGYGVLNVSYEPPYVTLPYHNELAYHSKFPSVIAFFCIRQSKVGGLTVISDNVKISKFMNPKIEQKMRKFGFRYYLNFQNRQAAEDGRETPWFNHWQRSFDVQSKQEMVKLLEKENFNVRWGKNDFLHLEYSNSGYHVSSMHDGFVFHMNAMVQSHGQYYDKVDPYNKMPFQQRPSHAQWGNGEELTLDEFVEIYKVYKEHEIAINYEAGDIILLDNLQYMHSRTPFEGDRSIVVVMGDPVYRVDPIF